MPNEQVRVSAVLLDVDGTLVDSNDAHAEAWVRALADAGIAVALVDVRRLIGMGGDKLLPAICGVSHDSPEGQRISNRRGDIFASEYLPNLVAFRDAHQLVAALKERNLTAVAASSAKEDELRRLLKIAGALSLLDGATSSDDVEDSKPDPDIIQAALKLAKASPREALMIGDTPYDIEAAERAGVHTIAFRCGGWDDASLRGAVAIYDGPWDLLAHLDASPLAKRVAR